MYTALFVPLSIAGGLGLALMLNRKIRFIGVYRALVFVPFVISATAQGVLFSFIFDAQFGIANGVLGWFGIPPQGFFADSNEALPLLVLIGLWSGLGFCVIVYLAGLQDIPQELIEAAAIDGARAWGTFRYVVWPALKPITVFLPSGRRSRPSRSSTSCSSRHVGAPGVHDRDRVLRLGPGVPAVHRRVCRGGGVRPRVHACSSSASA